MSTDNKLRLYDFLDTGTDYERSIKFNDGYDFLYGATKKVQNPFQNENIYSDQVYGISIDTSNLIIQEQAADYPDDTILKRLHDAIGKYLLYPKRFEKTKSKSFSASLQITLNSSTHSNTARAAYLYKDSCNFFVYSGMLTTLIVSRRVDNKTTKEYYNINKNCIAVPLTLRYSVLTETPSTDTVLFRTSSSNYTSFSCYLHNILSDDIANDLTFYIQDASKLYVRFTDSKFKSTTVTTSDRTNAFRDVTTFFGRHPLYTLISEALTNIGINFTGLNLTSNTIDDTNYTDPEFIKSLFNTDNAVVMISTSDVTGGAYEYINGTKHSYNMKRVYYYIYLFGVLKDDGTVDFSDSIFSTGDTCNSTNLYSIAVQHTPMSSSGIDYTPEHTDSIMHYVEALENVQWTFSIRWHSSYN